MIGSGRPFSLQAGLLLRVSRSSLARSFRCCILEIKQAWLTAAEGAVGFRPKIHGSHNKRHTPHASSADPAARSAAVSRGCWDGWRRRLMDHVDMPGEVYRCQGMCGMPGQ